MSSVIEFPGKEPPPEGYSKEHVDKLHAEAFRDLEGDVCDLDRMGQIAQDLIMNCVASKESFHDLELASFAVSQLAKMAKEFRANYEKRWHGELVGVSRAASSLPGTCSSTCSAAPTLTTKYSTPKERPTSRSRGSATLASRLCRPAINFLPEKQRDIPGRRRSHVRRPNQFDCGRVPGWKMSGSGRIPAMREHWIEDLVCKNCGKAGNRRGAQPQGGDAA